MVPTIPYDDGGARKLRSVIEVDCSRATIAFWNAEGERIIADTQFDGPPAPAGLRARIRGVIARDHDKWGTYCELFVRHPWSKKVWTTAAQRAARRHRLPNGSDEDVLQDALLRFCELLKAKIDLLAWLKEMELLEHFEPWFRRMVFNLSSASARNVPVFSPRKARQRGDLSINALRSFLPVLPSAPRRPDLPLDELLQNLADYRSNESSDRWNNMLAALARYPMLTRGVALLRSQGHTWDEVAAILRITVEAGRWAVEACREDLRRDFASFR